MTFLKKHFLNLISNVEDHRPDAALQTLRALFKDSYHSERIIQSGYSIIPFLNQGELEPLILNLSRFDNLRNGRQSGLFYTSGRDEKQARAQAKALSWPYVKDYLPRIFNLENTHAEGCAWLIKPPGDQGSLSPHQDSSLVDETQFASLYGWLPLQDVNEENGTIHVIPGSHLWGIHFRSLDVPWPLEGYTELLLKYSVPIEMKAGEMLLFEGALIHGSGINKTNQLRAALNFFFRPKEAQMLHFMVDGQTPAGMVESFKITAEFFLKHNFRERPDPQLFPFNAYHEFPTRSWSEKRLKRIMARFLP